MRKVQCCECGKHYDYDEDGFCPKCGAFNQPARAARIGADGSVIRVDGLSEAGHSGSFTHREFHAEERERKRMGLDKGVQRIPRPEKSAPAARASSASRQQGRKKRPLSVVFKVIFFIILLNLLLNFLNSLRWYI